MNILIVTNQLPWPCSAGGRASQFATLKALQNDHSFRIILSSYVGFLDHDANSLENSIHQLSVIRPLNKVLNESIKCSALSIVKRILKSFIRLLYKQSKKSVESAPGRAYYPFAPLSTDTIQLIIENLQWADIIQAEFHEALFLGTLPLVNIPKLFVCHQSHSLYTNSFYNSNSYKIDISRDVTEIMSAGDTLAAHQIESILMSNYERVIVFSQEDKDSIPETDSCKVIVSPFPLPADIKWVHPSNVEIWQNILVFIGPGNWHPNVDALEWYIDELRPRLIKKTGELKATLHVYGKWSQTQVEQYNSSGVIFHGYVDDLSHAIKGKVSINPVFAGAGLRTKLLASAAASSSIISTEIGAKGTGFRHRKHCVMADNPGEFVDSVICLFTDKQLRIYMANEAYEHVQHSFSPEAVRDKRNSIYNSMINK